MGGGRVDPPAEDIRRTEIARKAEYFGFPHSLPCGMLVLWNSALQTPKGDSAGQAYSSGINGKKKNY